MWKLALPKITLRCSYKNTTQYFQIQSDSSTKAVVHFYHLHLQFHVKKVSKFETHLMWFVEHNRQDTSTSSKTKFIFQVVPVLNCLSTYHACLIKQFKFKLSGSGSGIHPLILSPKLSASDLRSHSSNPLFPYKYSGSSKISDPPSSCIVIHHAELNFLMIVLAAVQLTSLHPLWSNLASSSWHWLITDKLPSWHVTCELELMWQPTIECILTMTLWEISRKPRNIFQVVHNDETD